MALAATEPPRSESLLTSSQMFDVNWRIHAGVALRTDLEALVSHINVLQLQLDDSRSDTLLLQDAIQDSLNAFRIAKMI